MSHSPLFSAPMFLILGLLTSNPLFANILIIQMRTDMVYGQDFDYTKVIVEDSQRNVLHRIRTSGPAHPWSQGVRIAEVDVPAGAYRVIVEAVQNSRGIVVSRPMRLTMDKGLRVLTVFLSDPNPPRTGSASAPADPPPPKIKLPQTRSMQTPKLPIPVAQKPAMGTLPEAKVPPRTANLTDTRQCFKSVQNRIAWDHSGNRQWSPANIQKLCSGAENSAEPAQCFQQLMHGQGFKVATQGWNWRDAIQLCHGSLNHSVTLNCYSKAVSGGRSKPAAIAACGGK